MHRADPPSPQRPPGPSPHDAFTPRVILAGILAVAAGLRFAMLGAPSFSYDEIVVVTMARARWHDVLPMLRAVEFHPPLYYLFMTAWAEIAGVGETAFRFPSACFGLASVGLTYGLARRVSSEPVSLLGALFVAVSPFQIMVSQEARMYALLGALVMASTLALAASVERGGPIRWAGYVLASALMVYTQYIGALVLLAHGIWVAAYERGRLARWMAAAAAAAVLYAPWIPSLWAQAFHLHGTLQSLGSAVTARDPGDLLGLIAFGGSLFGMANYLFPGTLGPGGQFAVLLPFLVILWRGGAALAADRRRLALLGLLPMVTVIATFALALANHYYYPRWLAFLVPFYAAFLAAGIVEIAERTRGWRERVAAVLTVGVLLTSVPVLARLYSDPGFNHFQWRAAASLVEHQGKPGDFFLYVNNATRTAFTYYDRDPHPSLTLTAANLVPDGDREHAFTDLRARDLATQHPRVWLIVSIPFTRSMQAQLFPALDRAFRVAGSRQYTGTGIYLLEARPR